MKVVEMVYEVHETCQNGKERIVKKVVYTDRMFRQEEGKKLLEDRGYYKVLFITARWKNFYVVK